MGTKFDMIGIFVADIHRMVAFYRDVLGLEIDWNGEGPYAEFKHEGIRLSMYARKELPQLLGQTPDFPQKLNGTFEMAINVAPENVDRGNRRRGGKPIYAPRDEPWKMRSAMTDPKKYHRNRSRF